MAGGTVLQNNVAVAGLGAGEMYAVVAEGETGILLRTVEKRRAAVVEIDLTGDGMLDYSLVGGRDTLPRHIHRQRDLHPLGTVQVKGDAARIFEKKIIQQRLVFVSKCKHKIPPCRHVSLIFCIRNQHTASLNFAAAITAIIISHDN